MEHPDNFDDLSPSGSLIQNGENIRRYYPAGKPGCKVTYISNPETGLTPFAKAFENQMNKKIKEGRSFHLTNILAKATQRIGGVYESIGEVRLPFELIRRDSKRRTPFND